MIYLIDGTNRFNFQKQIEEMYRIRHALYVHGRGWKALERPDGRDFTCRVNAKS
jgi:acyl-homoserine lactone synthase